MRVPTLPAGAERLRDASAVHAALERMAAAIERDLAGSDPLLLAVMIGGMMPAAWLASRLSFRLQLDYVHATRYRGAIRGGEAIDWLARPRAPLAGRTVLVVDDVLDEGHTLAAILADCRQKDAASVRAAVLVEKRSARRAPGVAADYVGMELEDRYLFGCGMDYLERYRQFPEIYAIAPEDEQ